MYKITFILVYLNYMLSICALQAKKESGNPKINFDTPYDTISTHVRLIPIDPKNLQKDAGMVFIGDHASIHNNKSHTMAYKLYKLIKEKQINIENIPRNPNYVDKNTGKHIYYLSKTIPRVYLIKHDGKWKYSTDTWIYIERYSKLFILKKFCYQSFTKQWCKKKVLYITLWQYIACLMFIIIAWVSYKTIPYFFKYIIKYIGLPNKRYVSLERLLFILITLYLLKVLLPDLFQFPALQILNPLSLMCLMYNCVNIIQERMKISQCINKKFTLLFLPLCSRVTKVVILLIGFIEIMTKLGYNTAPLVQSFLWSPFVIGIAAQNIIKNIFGSLMIIGDRAFNVGDEIVASTIQGKVEEIGLYATLLRTKEESIIYIPNAKLADMPIDNLGRRTLRIISLEIPLSYEVPSRLLQQFMDELKEIIKNQTPIYLEKTSLYLDRFDEENLILTLHIYLNTPHSNMEKKFKSEIIAHIIELAHQLGLRLGKIP